MSDRESAGRGWSIDKQAFDTLLAALNSDRARAAVAYEALRKRLIGLLAWWGSASAEELADETLDRVARKLAEGAVVAEGALGAYVRGVARMIFHEAGRRPRMVFDVPDIAGPPSPARDAEANCLETCLQTLPPADRRLVLRYYGEGKAADVRRTLAQELGISPTALRIRAHRVREQLERRMKAALEEAAP